MVVQKRQQGKIGIVCGPFLLLLGWKVQESKKNHLCGDYEEMKTVLSVRADQVVRKC